MLALTAAQTQEKTNAVDEVIARLDASCQGPDRSVIEQFAQQYYIGVPGEDILERSTEDLYGALLCHWRLARKRTPGTPVLEVYNPALETHGWRSRHTVIQLATDDMPFLVDSVGMELTRQGLATHLIVHPVMRVRRDAQGALVEVGDRLAGDGVVDEAIMQLEVDRDTDPDRLARVRAGVSRAIERVRAVVEDWGAMRAKMRAAIDAIEAQPLAIPRADRREAAALLRWLEDHHFTFIGFRAYTLTEAGGEPVLQATPHSGLGILRAARGRKATPIPAHLRALALSPQPLAITKSTMRSPVHRRAHLDSIGIKRFDAAGRVIGEWRFQGLYSSRVYDTRPSEIPLLRRKVAQAIARANLAPTSHAGKALQDIVDHLPRDEMFQASDEELYALAVGILSLQERRRLKLFVRADIYGRFVSALVYVPRESHSTASRLRLQAILMRAFHGQSADFNVELSESVLARLHFIIRTRPGTRPQADVAALEARLAEAVQSWQDKLRAALLEHFHEAEGKRLFARYGGAFPAGYQEDYSASTGVQDIARLEGLDERTPLALHLFRPRGESKGLLRFKVYGRHRPLALSAVIPVLERMGPRVLAARPFEIEPRRDLPLWLLEIDMAPPAGVEVAAQAIKHDFEDVFARVCRGEVENDGFNRLVVTAGLGWREVSLLRAACKYLLQTQAPFSQAYMEQSLDANPHIAQLLVALFNARLDPRGQGADYDQLEARLGEALDAVASLDEDRILRRFLAFVQATLRTNFFQDDTDGQPKRYFAFKLDPARIPHLPLPLPMYEIFVYAPWVEGVHLRGGPIARGGLRWSDRREDYRTEVLGLMKAQMVKNAVIVPVGAKGGFVAKRLPPGGDREAVQSEVIRCYRTFVGALLDVTDNRVADRIEAPPQVLRRDGDDPYLVVAADKGTASFSDIANELALARGFWLGDAFASGGSHGYDHKKMGITARGAWESVKRHFAELGVDTQRHAFTVVGIGDMSGDVFGNGMLCSAHIRLLAAFNHQHIFVDPDPDPAASYRERKRLFELARSSWADYDEGVLSAGGGVYARSAKSVAPSAEARAALGIEAERLTPDALIRAILRAPADLLWNGGIGTYVKAAAETHAEVGDRANDALRVDARELRCRAIGEGGNLGLTQRARIELARAGGLVNTDAIDNSGGVDCSDHEVNIKIALDQSVAEGRLSGEQRNRLLADMTEEVAALVLGDNYLQTQAISVEAAQAAYWLPDQARLINVLERRGRVKRRLDALPSEAQIGEREAAGVGLARPEIAVLLAYSKIELFEALRGADLGDDAQAGTALDAYFPAALRAAHSHSLRRHPLRREIVATQITNDLVNRMGSSFWLRVHEDTGAPASHVTHAYSAAVGIFRIDARWAEIEALDGRVPAATQIDMFVQTRQLIERATLWLLHNRRAAAKVAEDIAHFAPAAETVRSHLPRLLNGPERERLQRYTQRLTEARVPRELAERVAGLEALLAGLDIATIATRSGVGLETAAESYFELGLALELDWLWRRIHELPRRSHWHRGARAVLRDELHGALRALTEDCLQLTDATATVDRIEAWLAHRASHVDHYRGRLADLKAATEVDLAMLSVAASELRNLCRGG